MRRDPIQALLWPERTQESARHSLSDALYRIRTTLGRESILVEGESLRLNPLVIRVDVDDFQTFLEEGDLVEAVALYRGRFMEGFHLPGSHDFEAWRERESRRLGQDFETALEELADRAEEAGRPVEARRHWARLANHDPLNTHYQVAWMNSLLTLGDPGNAIQVGEAHARLLWEELVAEPPPELTELLDSLRTGGSRSPTPSLLAAGKEGIGGLPFQSPTEPVRGSSAMAFVGRREELGRLEGFLEDALRGKGGIAFLTGEAGTGKTALASSRPETLKGIQGKK
ncbi:MAG: BTAD domain-containing putative transcriptional regulator [Gemmatimonadota bacterium]